MRGGDPVDGWAYVPPASLAGHTFRCASAPSTHAFRPPLEAPLQEATATIIPTAANAPAPSVACLLYTSDDADDLLCVDLGGRRIIKKKKKKQKKINKT